MIYQLKPDPDSNLGKLRQPIHHMLEARELLEMPELGNGDSITHLDFSVDENYLMINTKASLLMVFKRFRVVSYEQ